MTDDPHVERVNQPAYKDADLLRELYVEKKLSTIKIADRLDCSPSTVQNYMDRFGIETRSQAESLAYDQGRHPNEVPLRTRPDGYVRWAVSRDGSPVHIYVHRLLAVAKYGFEAVANHDVHHRNEIKWDNRPENIEVLTHDEHSSIPVKVTEEDIQDFARRYEDGESTYSIAEDYPVTASTVARYVRESNVDLRSPGEVRHAQ